VLVLESVREELQLNEDQSQKIDELLAAWSKQETETANRLQKAASREEGREIFAKSSTDAAATWDQILELLTDDQETRFEQLKLQRSGLRTFVLPPQGLFKQLDVTREQREQWAEIYSDWDERYGLPKRGTKSWDKLMNRLLAVFSEQQRQQWDALVGKPFDFQSTNQRVRGFAVAFPNLGRDAAYLQTDWVRSAVELSDEQAKQIAAALDRWRKARDKIEQKLRSRGPGDDVQEVRKSALGLTDTAVEITDEINGILTDDQRMRLEQLQLQNERIRAFFKPAVRRELKLSGRQLQRINELLRPGRSVGVDDGDNSKSAAEQRRELMSQALEVLTAEQREKWTSMIGPPAEIPESALTRPQPGEARM